MRTNNECSVYDCNINNIFPDLISYFIVVKVTKLVLGSEFQTGSPPTRGNCLLLEELPIVLFTNLVVGSQTSSSRQLTFQSQAVINTQWLEDYPFKFDGRANVEVHLKLAGRQLNWQLLGLQSSYLELNFRRLVLQQLAIASDWRNWQQLQVHSVKYTHKKRQKERRCSIVQNLALVSQFHAEFLFIY